MRTTEEIYRELLAAFQERSGYGAEDSCDLAVRLYAVAAQVQALECQADWVLDQSFPQTAQGIYLDDHAAMRGIVRQEAAKAVGTLRFSVTDAPVGDLSIPQGKRVHDGERGPVPNDSGRRAVGGRADGGRTGEGAGGRKRRQCRGKQCDGTDGVPGGNHRVYKPGGVHRRDRRRRGDTLRARVLASFQRLPNGANAAFYEEQALRHGGVVGGGGRRPGPRYRHSGCIYCHGGGSAGRRVA